MQTKRELRWLEPWFFALRRRDRRGWQRRGWVTTVTGLLRVLIFRECMCSARWKPGIARTLRTCNDGWQKMK